MKNKGSAQITIQLYQGNITITHQNGTILNHIDAENLVDGAWEQMWECLTSLEKE